jgi:hypothetical protein
VATLRLGLRVVSGAHQVLARPVQVGLLAQPRRRTRRGSLLGQHFSVESGEEATRGERGIRTSENLSSRHFGEQVPTTDPSTVI